MQPDNVFLPPLHIKLGLMKIFVKAMDRSGDGFLYLKEKFPKLSEAKIKEGIFVGPQIRQLMKDDIFKEKLSDLEKSAWESFMKVTFNFLGNHRSNDYKTIVAELLSAYKALGWVVRLYVIENTLPSFTFRLFLKIWARSAMNMVKDSTKTFLPWKNDTRASGVHVC